MSLVHRDSHVVDWPNFGLPDRWRRIFDIDGDQEWLRVEEFHDGDTLVIRAELPDVDPDKDVQVTTTDGVVRIHAQREEKAEKKERRGYRTEFRYGEFEREILLPKGAKDSDVKATYSDGILEVRIPCPAHAESSPNQVPVTRT